LKYDDRTTIFHEAPHKLKATLADMCDIFGEDRRISLCRELTKLNEDVMRTTMLGAVEYYNENNPRGEYVLVVEGAPEGMKKDGDVDLCSLSVEAHVEHYINQGMTKKDAIKATAHDRGVPKNDIYIQFVNN
jgi:16S rRNA (cytidine1402-2'-O)-methyltransferase